MPVRRSEGRVWRVVQSFSLRWKGGRQEESGVGEERERESGVCVYGREGERPLPEPRTETAAEGS